MRNTLSVSHKGKKEEKLEFVAVTVHEYDKIQTSVISTVHITVHVTYTVYEKKPRKQKSAISLPKNGYM